jgi:hypothetical protein
MSYKKVGLAAIALASFVLLAIGASLLAGEVIHRRMQTPPRLKIVNRSGVELQQLRLEGSGFNEEVGTLPAGGSRWTEVYPTGESGVYVSFIANGQPHKSDYEGYFENSGGYRLIITVDKDFQVTVRNAIFVLP